MLSPRPPTLQSQRPHGAAIETLPALLVIGVLIAWTQLQGGFSATTWYPGALFLLLLLAVSIAAGRWRFRALTGPARVALVALLAFTAWSYLSITWADAKGIAWDGANRTLLYLVIFSLLSGLRLGVGRSAAVLGTWALGTTALAVLVLIQLPHVPGVPVVLGPGLANPVGYTNAEAAIWLMAIWPALALATRRELPPAPRALFAAAIVVLADTALLSQSRGSLATTGIVLVLFLFAVPGRARSLLTLAPPAVAIGLTAPHLLHVANTVEKHRDRVNDLGTVAGPILLAALAAGLVIGTMALVESYRPPAERVYETGRRAVTIAAIALAAAGVAAAVVAVGDPVRRVNREWRAFKANSAPDARAAGHLTAGFGGARYDYYRVALDVFAEHPVLGIGVDNFAEDYMARGRAIEFPTYPHSVELRALLQTGVVGALLLAVAIGAALLAAWRAMRGPPALAGVVAGGATMVFSYWFVQGSADWLWEFPALGGAAFATLGLAVGLASSDAGDRAPVRSRLARSARWAFAGALTLAATASLALPWTAALEIKRAESVWRGAPEAAFHQLDAAARLNPLADQPGLTAGSIGLRLGMLERARHYFEQALARDPRNAYATLELGAIASNEGRRQQALALVSRAVALNPQDFVTRNALGPVRLGQPIDITALNRQIAASAADAQR
ncbi:MAG TPA: O-antigen ligase family protein [Solirubrobacteraceae bacterium]|nr:O-antigen ligase family protein [Solirubrobacteraceae bacterium]